jgi:hypothetical protein
MAFSSLLGRVGFQKKKNSGSEHNAILLPHQSQHGLMEDYEIAAFHNQA